MGLDASIVLIHIQETQVTVYKWAIRSKANLKGNTGGKEIKKVKGEDLEWQILMGGP